MPLPLTPPGNGSDPCAGVRDYFAAQNFYPAPVFWLNIILFATFTVAMLVSSVVVWMLRKHSRFAKIRPVSLSWLVLFGFVLDTSAGVMGEILDFPCVYLVVAYCVSLAFFATTLASRGLVFSLEARYAEMAKRIKVFDDSMETSSATHSQSQSNAIPKSLQGDAVEGVCRGTAVLLQVSFGLRKISDLTFHDIKFSRNSFWAFACIYSLPGIVGMIVLVAAIPAMTGECALECRDVYLELPITFFVVLIVYILIVSRSVYMAFKVVGWDDKGVMTELLSIPVCGSLAGVVWIVVLIDPGELTDHHIFSWQVLFVVVNWLYWWVCFGYQFWVVWKTRASKRVSSQDSSGTEGSSSDNHGGMMEMLESDSALKEEFTNYAAKQYISELIRFLEDVLTYQKLFFEKGETWRASKAKMLVKTYIAEGADLEVNISDETRSDILERCTNLQFQDLFLEAFHEVEQMVQFGAWREFRLKKNIRPPSRVKSAALASSPA